MSVRSQLFYWPLIFIAASCATYRPDYGKFVRTPDANEQCELLAKNRAAVSRTLKRPSRKAVIVKRGEQKGFSQELSADPRHEAQTTKHGDPANELQEPAISTESIALERESPEDTGARKDLIVRQGSRRARGSAIKSLTSSPNVATLRAGFVETGSPRYSMLPYLIGGSGLLSMLAFAFRQKKLRVLSEWAASHPWSVRSLLTATQIGTAFGAIAVGDHLAAEGIAVQNGVMYGAMATGMVAASFYPLKNSRIGLLRASYFRRKVHDIALFTSGTILMMYLGNHYEVIRGSNPPAGAVYSMASVSGAGALSLVKESISPPVQADPAGRSVGVKILLTFLAAALFVGLAMLVGAAACSLACNGMEFLSGLVLIGGVGGLIALLIFAIRRIFGMSKKQASTS